MRNEASLDISQKLVEIDPTNTQQQGAQSDIYSRLGDVYFKRGELDTAQKSYEAAQDIDEQRKT